MAEKNTDSWVEAGTGIRRRILAHNAEAMTVEVEFQNGAVGEPHHHEHVQTIFVQAGRFAFTVNGEQREYGAGESLVIPSNAVHGCVALEAGTLIDGFVPRRDDFL